MSARTEVRVGRRAGAEPSHRAEPGRRPRAELTARCSCSPSAPQAGEALTGFQ